MGSHVFYGQNNCSDTKHLPVYWAFRSLFNINSGKNDSKHSQQNRAYAGSPQSFAHKQGSAYEASL